MADSQATAGDDGQGGDRGSGNHTAAPDIADSFTILPSEIRDSDVLMGRGARAAKHPGNVYFRSLVQTHKNEYNGASFKCSRSDGPMNSHRLKHSIAQEIVDEITHLRNGRFLCRLADMKSADSKVPLLPEKAGKQPRDAVAMEVWTLANPVAALEKVKQALREKEPQSRRSSKKVNRCPTNMPSSAPSFLPSLVAGMTTADGGVAHLPHDWPPNTTEEQGSTLQLLLLQHRRERDLLSLQHSLEEARMNVLPRLTVNPPVASPFFRGAARMPALASSPASRSRAGNALTFLDLFAGCEPAIPLRLQPLPTVAPPHMTMERNRYAQFQEESFPRTFVSQHGTSLPFNAPAEGATNNASSPSSTTTTKMGNKRPSMDDAGQG